MLERLDREHLFKKQAPNCDDSHWAFPIPSKLDAGIDKPALTWSVAHDLRFLIAETVNAITVATYGNV